MSIILNGIGVSHGIAIGNAYVYVRATTEATEYNVPAKYHLNEIETMLADSDFSILAIFGGYSEKPLSPDDPSIVLIAQQ